MRSQLEMSSDLEHGRLLKGGGGRKSAGLPMVASDSDGIIKAAHAGRVTGSAIARTDMED
jgi:hypothetical protein